MPVESLRYIAFSHVEADECGSLNEWLPSLRSPSPCAARSRPWYRSATWPIGRLARSLMEILSLGKHPLRWIDTPHLPHAWECGFMMEEQTSTLLCGDLFTQGGADFPP